MKKSEKKYDKRYEWATVTHSRTGEERQLSGYGTEMCLKPVPVDPDTGEQAIFLAGKNKGQKKSYPTKDWQTGKVTLVWMWPGTRIATLLKMLDEERLVGDAKRDVQALWSVVHHRKVPAMVAASEGWANDIVDQEEKKHEEQKARYREEKSKLSKRRGKRKAS